MAVLRFVYLDNFRQVAPVVKNHLKRVYLILICALVASAVGVYLHMLLNIGGLFTSLGLIGSMSWLHKTHTNQQSTKRFCLLFLSTILKGASVGPMIELAIDLDSRILTAAFVVTAVAFACHSAAAMLARRREYFYLGSMLTSGLPFIFRLHIASFFNIGYVAAGLFKLELYLGLYLFAGFMLLDTQEIIETAHDGDRDYVEHSFTFFTNFVAVFVRVLIVLMLKHSAHKVEKDSMALAALSVCEITKTLILKILAARAREE